MKLLITGGSGLIGSELVNSIVSNFSDTVELIIIDKVKPKFPFIDGSWDFFQADITDENVFNKFPNIDGIIHLASTSRVITAEKNPFEAWNNNINGLKNILQHYTQQPQPPFIIYGSSREVYGEPDNLPVTEDFPLFPINHYGMTKLLAETLIKEYSKKTNTHCMSLRFSNVYGNLNDQMDRVIPKFLLRAMNNDKLELQGENNLFDFTHVSDTVKGIMLGLQKIISSKNKNQHYSVYNICTGKGTTLRELAELIIKITDSKSEIIRTQRRSYDVQRFIGDYSLANKELGYFPSTKLSDGIRSLKELIEKNIVHATEKV